MKKVIRTEQAPKAIGPYSQAILAGNFLFASGQIPIDPSNGQVVCGGIENQVKQVMENIKNVLAAADMGLNDIIKTTVFITDMDNFPKVNEIYGSYFDKTPPARSCVEVSKLPKGVEVEIEVVAYKNSD